MGSIRGRRYLAQDLQPSRPVLLPMQHPHNPDIIALQRKNHDMCAVCMDADRWHKFFPQPYGPWIFGQKLENPAQAAMIFVSLRNPEFAGAIHENIEDISLGLG